MLRAAKAGGALSMQGCKRRGKEGKHILALLQGQDSSCLRQRHGAHGVPVHRVCEAGGGAALRGPAAGQLHVGAAGERVRDVLGQKRAHHRVSD